MVVVRRERVVVAVVVVLVVVESVKVCTMWLLSGGACKERSASGRLSGHTDM